MTETRFLARFATIANAAFNSMTANSTAITSMSIGGAAINATSFAGTANNANNLGGVAAASYQLNSTLAANVATMAANSATFTNSSATNTFTVGTAAYFVANGNVGIGTTTPSVRLDVAAVSNTANDIWTGGTDFLELTAVAGSAFSEQAIAFQEAGTNVGAKIGVKNRSNGAYDIIFANRDTSSFTSAMTERMRIRADGNVGIGIATPGGRLGVSSNRAAVAYSQVWSVFNGGSFENDVILGYQGTHTFFGNFQNNPLTFLTNAAERMRIAADGNVGVGITNPVARLQVSTGAVNGTDGILVSGGTTNRGVVIRPSMGAGNSNGLVQAGDSGIIFDGGTFNTGAFVLAPWNTEAACGLRMDSSGRVVMPNQPFAHIEGFAGNFEVTGVTGVLTGGSGLYFTGSMYNSVNGRFTVPVAGNYLIAFAGITQSTDTADTQVLIEVNGTQRGRAYSGGYSGGSLQWRALSFTGVYKLNANDYITFNKNVGTLHGNFFPFRTVYLLG